MACVLLCSSLYLPRDSPPSSEILLVRNLPLDWFSFALYLWNFGVMGLVVIHWKGPLRLQQAYLILVSALVVGHVTSYGALVVGRDIIQ